MMTRIKYIATVLALFWGLFLVAPPWTRAQGVDEEIKALKEKLATLESQQIEMKKEAEAATAAMPTFSYRPGNGLNIEAADKSWSFRTSVESHFRLNFLSGRDQRGRSQGELEGRRFRPYFFYCINNCLWEIEAALDLDGFGGGNGKNATGDDFGSILQRGAVQFHAEDLHPWLPTVQFGMEVQNAQGGSLARQGSGSVGAQAEYDLHTSNNGFNTGRAGSGIVFNWDDRSLSSIGIPGRLRRFQMSMAAIAEGDDGLQSFTDRKDFNVYGSIQPFSQVKNKWISGLTFEYGSWFCNHDNRAIENGCSRYRIRDNARGGGRKTLFDTGSESIGDGLHIAHGPGIVYNVGPYTLRLMGHFQSSEDRGGTRGKKRANSFLIGHDLFLWSPKGFLTGSATTAGSVLVGTHFERVNMSCTIATLCATINSGDFHRERVILREWDLWYFIAPRMSVGGSLLWYDASNLRNGINQEAHDLGICSRDKITAGGCRNGTGGDWVDVFLNWRYTF
ncbi:MAG TPA: hypothetical protein VMT22_04715 [Terriglobales bacterium]|nr:hypothetical protein [Terriglobales bacterium]